MLNLSTALRAAIATEYGLAAMMRYGHIRIFSGAPPLTADMAEQGELLATITEDGLPFVSGTGQGALNLVPGPISGACQMDGNWKLTVLKSGTAGWWRFVWNGADYGTADEWTPRIDAPIGQTLVLPDNALIKDDVWPVSSFFLLIPPTSN